MYASRNLSNCTKDCLCLFVCPTGATDTETGQIDSERCLDGCRLCVDACPSHAIYLVVENYAEPASKNEKIAELLLKLCESKYMQESYARGLFASEGTSAAGRIGDALIRSFRVVAEDCAREAGFMLPQSSTVKALLTQVMEDPSFDAADDIRKLIQR